jgi:hypothetical protein
MMDTASEWRSHTRSADNPPTRQIFPGRPTDEDTADHDQSWSAAFDDTVREMPTVPPYVTTVAIAAVAAGTGLAVGYWLGGRPARRTPAPFSLAHADFTDFAKLAPEVAHLFKNPVIRALAARAIIRQVNRMLAS